MSGRSRTLVIGAVAVAICAAAGLGIWRAVDDPDPAGAAATLAAVPIEPGSGDGGGDAEEPGAQTGLDVRGTVLSVAIFDVTYSDQQAVGSILVKGPPSDTANYDVAQVTVTKDTRIFAYDHGVQEVHPDLVDLRGRRVEVAFTGPVAESYPVQATAAWITILD